MARPPSFIALTDAGPHFALAGLWSIQVARGMQPELVITHNSRPTSMQARTMEVIVAALDRLLKENADLIQVNADLIINRQLVGLVEQLPLTPGQVGALPSIRITNQQGAPVVWWLRADEDLNAAYQELLRKLTKRDVRDGYEDSERVAPQLNVVSAGEPGAPPTETPCAP